MKPDATKADIEAVCTRIRELGFIPHQIPGSQRVAIGITGNESALDPDLFSGLSGMAEAVPVSRPWKLVSRETKPEDTVIDLPGPGGQRSRIGGGTFGVIAGPCAVESESQLF